MILDILEKSKTENKLIAVQLYGGDEGFWCGYVKSYSDEIVIIQHFTKYGKSDGVIAEKIVNIESIDFEDDYSQSMEHIIEHAHEIDFENEITVEIERPDQWQKEMLEANIGSKERIVRVQLNHGNQYSGFVDWCDDENLILGQIDIEGRSGGKTICKIEDITSIRINDIESRKRLLLFNWRKSN